MLLAKIFLVIVLFLTTYALKEKNYSRFSHVHQLTDDHSRIKKRQNDPDYYEQCRFVNVWSEQFGHVNVLAFLDPSWQYSFRQAVMLKILNTRLRKSGFSNILFFVITPPPNLKVDKTENDIEIQAWREISMLEPENFINAKDHFLKDTETEIIFVQDSTRIRIWERFRASRDQVVVIDRCGRLTYQVIVPWSILHFPYVKAAILSTYQEDPCGACDPSIYKTSNYNEYFLSLTNNTDQKPEPYRTGNITTDPIWTTERLENVTVHPNDSLENGLRTSNISAMPSDEITNDAKNSNLANVTESFVESTNVYRYNDTSKLPINGDNLDMEETESQEKSMDLDNSTISSVVENSDNKVTITSELQPNATSSIASTVKSHKEDYVSLTASSSNRTLLDQSINEVRNDSSRTIEKVSNVSGEAQNENDKNVDISSESFSEYGQNDSADINAIVVNSKENSSNVRNEINALSLRIIMHAPHTHTNGKKAKKHTHLILKTGNPNYHGHLDSETDIASSTNLSRDTDLQETDSEEYSHEASELDTNKGSPNQKYTFDKDESPGLYGEILDYWRSCEDNDIANRNETSNNNYNNTMINYDEEYHVSSVSHNVTNHTVDLSESSEINEKYSSANITISANTEDSIANRQDVTSLPEIDSSITTNISVQINKEEEIRNKLIEHYNKLLPWIYYILKN